MVGENAAAKPLLKLTAITAIQKQVDVIDAVTQFDPQYVALQVRKQSVKVEQALNHIQIVRIFHVSQWLDALQDFQDSPHPLVILGGLSLFMDEAIRLHHRKYIFQQLLRGIIRCAVSRSVIVGIRPSAEPLEYPWNQIRERAAQVFETGESAAPKIVQNSFFDLSTDTSVQVHHG